MSNYHPTPAPTAIPNNSAPLAKPFTELFFRRSFEREGFAVPSSDNATKLFADAFVKAIVDEYFSAIDPDGEPPASPVGLSIPVLR
ncbi:hypothetical protein [Rhizobium leguminosarum]|uniref:hypothetical protein n=1 Tax=Rhizobium leguminosarum TaxID=384 RepID=UPI00143F7083|nr:hypothetical protein [Rhizobium leguminosarum]NKL21823.1 hypothetical protein [Rhizobium leguminosarum bv. viciae]